MTKGSEPRRHFLVPDTQIRPGVPLDHIDWIAKAIVEYLPDVIIVGGDWWDFPSLSRHNDPGSLPTEGQRYVEDLKVGNEAFARLCAPMEAEIARRIKQKTRYWKPRKVFLTGNHEDRADRAAIQDPRFFGHIGSENCDVRDFERHAFGEIVEIDGVQYSHLFSNPHSGRAIGGTPQNRLNKIANSFTMFHVQGFDYGTKVTPTGRTLHGGIFGSCYLHHEDYRGVHQAHFRGVIVKNEVKDGDYCIMPLTLDYMCRKYTGKPLLRYMAETYPGGDWSYLQ